MQKNKCTLNKSSIEGMPTEMDKLKLSLNTRYIRTMMRCTFAKIVCSKQIKWGEAVNQIEK